jgi:hypothetical protein
VFVPAGTPREIVTRLNTEINKALGEAAIRDGFFAVRAGACRGQRRRLLAARGRRFRHLRTLVNELNIKPD